MHVLIAEKSATGPERYQSGSRSMAGIKIVLFIHGINT